MISDDRLVKLLTNEQAQTILQLRLLIARAADKDSLAWWDDDSLTEAGSYILQRLFPIEPSLAAARLALEAALKAIGVG